MKKFWLYFGVFFLIVAIIFESSILYLSYANADEIKCNWLWCEFKTTRENIDISINSECSQNGVKINCSEINNIDYYKKLLSD